MSELTGIITVLFVVAIGLYTVVNLIASLHTAVKWDFKLLPVLPFVFACFHFGYGLGFLMGVWDMLILGRSPSEARYALTR